MTRLITRLTDPLEPSPGNIKRLFKGYAALLMLFLYFPIVVVVLLSFTPNEIASFPLEGISFQWYDQLLPPDYNERLVEALWRSVYLGVITAVLTGIIGTAGAMGMVRSNFNTRFLDSKVLQTVFIAPIAVPWVVTGISLALFYNLLNIVGTFQSLLIGHVLITIPFVVLVIGSRLRGFDRSMEEAARNLGASRLRTFYEVTLPLIMPSVIAGMLFAFTISFGNFTQTYFWVSVETQTLPVVIFAMLKTGLPPTVNAVGTLIIVISVVLGAAAESLSSRVFS